MSNIDNTELVCCICSKSSLPKDGTLYDGEFYCAACLDEKYDNKTGYCSFDCCMGGGCDGSC
jgi:hypothetical protein